jgi:hypothetical protein
MLRKGVGTKAIQAALGVDVAKIITIKRELGIEVGRARRSNDLAGIKLHSSVLSPTPLPVFGFTKCSPRHARQVTPS